MKKTLFVFGLISSITIFSQPVIINGDKVPGVGLSVPVSIASTSSFGSSGANQTWDFSSLSFTAAGSIEVITPSSAPIGSSFAGANYAWGMSLSGQNLYSFFNVTPNKMEVMAFTYSGAGAGKDYSPNPRTLVKFPFNYLDTETDTWQKTGGSLEMVTLTYDGYGTFITPTATYTDVVRIKEDYGGNEVDYQWYILDPFMVIAIFDHNSNMLYHFGATQTAGISSQNENLTQISVYPNPAANYITINNIPTASSLFITDLSGKQVYQSTGKETQETIDTENFANGMYLLHIENNKNVIQKRFVINK